MGRDVAKASLAFLLAAGILTCLSAYSFFSPLALRTETPSAVFVSRALAHFLPVLPPLLVGLGLRFSQVWAWYLGVLYMTGLFGLGIFLSLEHFVFLLHGHFVLPIFLLLSLIALPCLVLLLRGRMRTLRQLRHARS